MNLSPNLLRNSSFLDFFFFMQSDNKCGHASCTLAALRGLRNGIEYACRIRVAHCLVMILLYRRDKSLRSNLDFLMNAAREHAVNLGVFVMIFKFLRCTIQEHGGLNKGAASFISGGICGAVVWGRKKSAINYQVILYLLSRIVTGFVQHQVRRGNIPDKPGFLPLAAFVWAMVMYLFTVDPDSLQGSLRNSMEFLYNDDEDLIPDTKSLMRAILPFIPFSGV